MNTPYFKTNYVGALLTVLGGDPKIDSKMNTFKRTLNISQENQRTLSEFEGVIDVGSSSASFLPICSVRSLEISPRPL